MRVAASNLAWPAAFDAKAFSALRECGFTGVEVAPTKVWQGWEGATGTAAATLRSRLADEGLAVPALQSILFGAADATLFGGPADRMRLRDHLLRVADLAAALGAGSLVLGAPGARDRKELAPEVATAIACEFLVEIGPHFAARGATLLVEPNPPAYGCNFVTTSAEGRALIDAVATAGVGLHLDAAGMLLAGEDPVAAVRDLAGRFGHFHASEPQLGSFDAPVVPHEAIGQALAETGYGGWVSLEMREPPDAVLWPTLTRALAVVRASYGDSPTYADRASCGERP